MAASIKVNDCSCASLEDMQCVMYMQSVARADNKNGCEETEASEINQWLDMRVRGCVQNS